MLNRQSRDVVLNTRVANFSDAEGMRTLLDSLIAQFGKCGAAAFGSVYVPETYTLHIMCSKDGRIASHSVSPLTDSEAIEVYRRIITAPLDFSTQAIANAVDAVIGVNWATVQ